MLQKIPLCMLCTDVHRTCFGCTCWVSQATFVDSAHLHIALMQKARKEKAETWESLCQSFTVKKDVTAWVLKGGKISGCQGHAGTGSPERQRPSAGALNMPQPTCNYSNYIIHHNLINELNSDNLASAISLQSGVPPTTAMRGLSVLRQSGAAVTGFWIGDSTRRNMMEYVACFWKAPAVTRRSIGTTHCSLPLSANDTTMALLSTRSTPIYLH